MRTGGRVVEGARLESVCTRNRTVSSNLILSAIYRIRLQGLSCMKIVRSTEAQTYTSAASLSESVEYPVDDKDIDCALVKINGLYPGDDKFAVNTKSKALFFCTKLRILNIDLIIIN